MSRHALQKRHRVKSYSNKLKKCVLRSFLKHVRVCFVPVWNLIMNICWEFRYDDVTVTSFVNIKYGDVATQSIL